MGKALVQIFLLLGTLCFTLVQGEATNATSLTVEQKKLQYMESSMDLDQPVCTNFYKYACKKWSFFIASEALDVLETNVETQMENIIEVFPTLMYPEFLKSIHNHYQSCKSRDEFDVLDYLKWMNEHTDIKWPLVKQKEPPGMGGEEKVEESTPLDWIELLALTRTYGLNDIFIYETVVQRQEDPNKLIVVIKRPPLHKIGDLKHQIYDPKGHLQHMDLESFRNFQIDLLNLTVHFVERVEKASFEVIMDSTGRPSDTKPLLVKVNELQMPWLVKYLETLLNRRPLDAGMEIYINSVEYLQSVYSLMNARGNRFMNEYIQLRFFIYLQEKFFTRSFKCVQYIRESFPLVMQWAYEKNNLQLKWQIPRVEKIYENLKAEFRQSLQTNSYNFSEYVQQYLLDKLDGLTLMVGQMNVLELQRYYTNMSLVANKYYGNHLQIANFHFKRLHEALGHEQLTSSSPEMWHLQQFVDYGQRLEKTLSLAHLPKLYPRLNVIYLPLTVLQPPYYEDGLSDEFIYGSLGFWLAHEIVKSFDQHHLVYDAKGKVNTQMLQQIQTNRKYKKSLWELRHNFPHYDLEDKINDLGGLKLAYNAFSKLKLAHHLNRSFTLNNSSFTSDQLFFLNYAQNFCSTLCGFSDLGGLFYNCCDRVNLQVQRLKEFDKAFNCQGYSTEPIW
uniref:Peptidase M13 N-terminal domain-containing protein n=1 Tax=Stomoxys calcitrans TaxID=35570 RepID=A0A1I8PEW3_STOCA